MEPRPVSQRAKPAYPTRREFLAGSAAALSAAGIWGCGKDATASALVAPVFFHGEGRGATGCIVLAPPVFLSEEEALQVIRGELSKAGIKLGQGMSLPEVTVEYEDPDLRWMRSADNWLGEPVPIVSYTADLAAVDRRRRVGIAMVTRDDCRHFRGGYFSTASSYDTKGVAQAVADALRKQTKENLCVGVFYDPLEKRDRGDRRGGGKQKSRAQLGRQAQDFVVWWEKNR